jgi:hypothetical protein
LSVRILADFTTGQEAISYEEEAFSIEQIIAVLKQAKLGLPVSDLIQKTEFPSRPPIAERSNMEGFSLNKLTS